MARSGATPLRLLDLSDLAIRIEFGMARVRQCLLGVLDAITLALLFFWTIPGNSCCEGEFLATHELPSSPVVAVVQLLQVQVVIDLPVQACVVGEPQRQDFIKIRIHNEIEDKCRDIACP